MRDGYFVYSERTLCELVVNRLSPWLRGKTANALHGHHWHVRGTLLPITVAGHHQQTRDKCLYFGRGETH